MKNEKNNVNKDTANSLSKYSDYANKGTNLVLDSANAINKWYAEQLDKITNSDINSNRLETLVDNSTNDITNTDNESQTKIETKINTYDELQTNNNINKIKKIINIDSSKIKTKALDNENIDKDNEISNDIGNIEGKNNTNNIGNTVENISNKNGKIPKRIATTIKSVKMINNTTNKIIKTGKNINTVLNEGGLKGFENTSSRIMTKPIKNVTNKVVSKTTKVVAKNTKKVAKKVGTKVIQQTTNLMIKIMKVLMKLIVGTMKLIISMLPQIAPVIIIIVIIAAFCNFFGIGMSEDTLKEYESYMIETQKEYDKITVEYYNSGKVVDGSIDGKGMINWRAPLSILQMLNGELTYDNAEKELLEEFKDAELYEKITEESYTYEKTSEETDKEGNTTTKTETVTETKKVVKNGSLDDFISWCNNNFDKINKYKKQKKLDYDKSQTKFTDSEIEQIRLLYNSNSFFDLFSEEFKTTYAYLNVNISDEQIRAIYEEFLKNVGKRYLMDHSNLKYDECMDYYDCSSWVIHCLAHTGIKKIPNTGAEGLYRYYCYPVSESDRKPGDLIFLKNTYGNFPTEGIESITHIGIYMGELNINGEIAEWVIDTGSNPSGVRIRKYNNGWWNGSNFYGFGRLKNN